LLNIRCSGILRIKNFCAEYNLIEPKFEDIQKGFQVTLYKTKHVNKLDTLNLGVNQVLEFIALNQPTKSKNIAVYFSVTQRTIERYLKQLKDSEKIEFKGETKAGGYYVKSPRTKFLVATSV